MSAFRSLTVGALRAALERFPDDLPVAVAAPSGDYWGRTLALSVHHLREEEITFSTYHDQHIVPSTERDEEEPDDVQVLLLH